jgi:hypothetical protein
MPASVDIGKSVWYIGKTIGVGVLKDLEFISPF